MVDLSNACSDNTVIFLEIIAASIHFYHIDIEGVVYHRKQRSEV